MKPSFSFPSKAPPSSAQRRIVSALATVLTCLLLAASPPAAHAQLEVVAGTGEAGYNGDGGPADKAQINNPFGVIVGPDGDIYFCDTGNHTVRKISRKSGKISTVVGTGEKGYSGDG
ncbi:MAG: hypothetical protein HKN60_07780, partial [Rhizobiales bacterium]|nr:hypothetical protein [Hyphomicrobiales bacterium]